MQRGCSELTWLLEEGQTSNPCQAASLTLAPSIPQISADSREVFPPARTNSSTILQKSSPASAARAGGRKKKAPWRREHIWNQLETAECLGKNCRAGRNHREELRVRTWLWSKGGERDVCSIFKHKTRAPLEAVGFFSCKQLNVSALSYFHCHWPTMSMLRIQYRRQEMRWGKRDPSATQVPGLSHAATTLYQAALTVQGGGSLWLTWQKFQNRNLMV